MSEVLAEEILDHHALKPNLDRNQAQKNMMICLLKKNFTPLKIRMNTMFGRLPPCSLIFALILNK